MPPSAPPLLLTRREPVGPGGPEAEDPLRLALSARQRTSLRGHRRSLCGTDLVLHLPRGAPLLAGEWLTGPTEEAWVRVEAAPERLLAVHSGDAMALLQAAYHLGNRHVVLQLLPGELRLEEDPVLADLLRGRGLEVEPLRAPFEPEPGAYAPSHLHSHSHGAASSP